MRWIKYLMLLLPLKYIVNNSEQNQLTFPAALAF